MPVQYKPLPPAIDVTIGFTFTPGCAELPGMKLWLDGSEISIPAEISAYCERLGCWPYCYPDQQLRVVLCELFKRGFSSELHAYNIPPHA